jgi:hypothetical protein
MKMGTIRSPCSYEAAARHARQSANLRGPAILHYPSCAAVFPISQVVRLPFDAARAPQAGQAELGRAEDQGTAAPDKIRTCDLCLRRPALSSSSRRYFPISLISWSLKVRRSGHTFGHSFRRTECEQTVTNVTKITDFSTVGRCEASFGTRGSQVQILPLRPILSQKTNLACHRIRHRLPVRM